MKNIDTVAWSERAIAWKDEAPAIEGPLETVINAISRLPSLSWMSFSITLPDRPDSPTGLDGSPTGLDGKLTRALVAKLRQMPRT